VKGKSWEEGSRFTAGPEQFDRLTTGFVEGVQSSRFTEKD